MLPPVLALDDDLAVLARHLTQPAHSSQADNILHGPFTTPLCVTMFYRLHPTDIKL